MMEKPGQHNSEPLEFIAKDQTRTYKQILVSELPKNLPNQFWENFWKLFRT